MLKAVVIGLGVLILIGVGLIAYKLIDGQGSRAVQSPGDYATDTVTLPAGSRVVTMTGEGDRLSLLVEDGAGRQQVITIDRSSGAVLGTLTLEPQN